MYDAMLAETVTLTGHGGDRIEGYLARPMGPGPYPGVVVIHHAPGYDEPSREITRRFATAGYAALCPNLHAREAGRSSADEAAALVKAEGGVPDERCMGDLAAAAGTLRELSNASGKVGVIGYCSGGRQAFIAAAQLDLDAAAVCYGGRIVATEENITERTPVSPVDMTPAISAPLLGLFGADDPNPGPDMVATIDKELDRHGKLHEFTTFEGAGHGFFATDRPSYRTEAATKGWELVFDWFERHLRGRRE